MLAAIVAGLFSLAPLVVIYASSRERRLRLMKAEIEILKGLRETERPRGSMEDLLDRRLQDYVEEERARSDPRTQVSRWRKRTWVWALIGYSMVPLTLAVAYAFPAFVSEVAFSAIIVIVAVVVLVGFYYSLRNQRKAGSQSEE
jgi:hypothetical protein